MNILTFDIEEWFHLLDFDDTRSEKEWSKYEVRIYKNVDRILNLLEESNTKATFMIVGWIAKTYPDIVKKIAERYQIGTHSMNHQLIWQQGPRAFREDLEASVKLLQDLTGQPVECYRAPGFSIRESELWAFDIIADVGIKYDLSVFPSHHAHGGLASYPYNGPATINTNYGVVREFPIPVRKVLGRHLIYSGGGYFRLFPYSIVKRWSKQNPDYLLSYIHPRDLDGDQPMLEGLPLARKFKSYVGCVGAEEKLKKYLRDFKFTDVRTAVEQINWANVPVFNLK